MCQQAENPTIEDIMQRSDTARFTTNMLLGLLRDFVYNRKGGFLKGAATQRWILEQLYSKTVLAHIGALPNECTIKHPLHTTAT
jgi:hypothetical protein